MSKYIIHDNGLDREATSSEAKEIEARHAQALVEEQVITHRAAVRASALAKLAALGLTEAEITALVGA